MTSTWRMRWRVERAGAQRYGYDPGWFAVPIRRHVILSSGQWFATWGEAMEYALGGPLVSEATA